MQLHAGPPMQVQFKDIRIKPLPADTAGDLDGMQGDWAPVEFVANGSPLPADDLAAIKLKVKGNEYFVDAPDVKDQGSIKLNVTTNPKSMDVTSGSGAEVPAIYELTRETLKVCYAVDGGSRPTEFKSGDGSGRVLATYKRKQP